MFRTLCGLVLLFSILTASTLLGQANAPVVQAGRIDLHNWIPGDKPLKLKGEWHFHFNRHFTEDDLRTGRFLSEDPSTIKAPGGAWADVQAGVTGPHGFVSYVIRIEGLRSDPAVPLGLQIAQFAGNHDTFLVIPSQQFVQKILSVGITTSSAESTIPQMKKVTSPLPQLDGSTIYLVMLALNALQKDLGRICAQKPTHSLV